MNLTKDKFFIDTNIIVYLFNKDETDKNKIAEEIVKHAIKSGNGIISYQVIQEFCNVALRKFKEPMKVDDCDKFINKYLYTFCDIFPGIELYTKALKLHDETKYSFYDSLILVSAIMSHCKIIYSEDMQNNQKLQNIKIVNPFI
jgi:predicted nucleic acid-binding protein